MSAFFRQCRSNKFLQHDAQKHARRAADERIPEVGNGKSEVEDKIKCLRNQGRPENRRAANVPDEKCHDKKAEHHAVKNGAKNVHRLDQIFREMSVEGEANRDQPPKCGEPFWDATQPRRGRRVALDEMAVKVNGGARSRVR